MEPSFWLLGTQGMILKAQRGFTVCAKHLTMDTHGTKGARCGSRASLYDRQPFADLCWNLERCAGRMEDG